MTKIIYYMSNNYNTQLQNTPQSNILNEIATNNHILQQAEKMTTFQGTAIGTNNQRENPNQLNNPPIQQIINNQRGNPNQPSNNRNPNQPSNNRNPNQSPTQYQNQLPNQYQNQQPNQQPNQQLNQQPNRNTTQSINIQPNSSQQYRTGDNVEHFDHSDDNGFELSEQTPEQNPEQNMRDYSENIPVSGRNNSNPITSQNQIMSQNKNREPRHKHRHSRSNHDTPVAITVPVETNNTVEYIIVPGILMAIFIFLVYPSSSTFLEKYIPPMKDLKGYAIRALILGALYIAIRFVVENTKK